VLGLGPAHAKFWDLPDSRLDRLSVSDRSAAIGRLADLICSLRPDETFLPYREGGSSEHSAACDLGLRALEQAGIGRGLQYPVWGWWDPRRLHPRLREDGNLRLELDGADRRRKREALACHRSQVEATPPWRSPVLPPVLAAACIGPEEFFFASVADAPQVD
jgi:LmbE family N-acetylglucosaminyl deacetylase